MLKPLLFLHFYVDVLQMIMNKEKLRNTSEINISNLKDDVPDEIIDHCAGLLLIKPICSCEVWEYLDKL